MWKTNHIWWGNTDLCAAQWGGFVLFLNFIEGLAMLIPSHWLSHHFLYFLQTGLLTGCSSEWNFTLRSQTIYVKNLQGKTRSRQIRLTREYKRMAFSGAELRRGRGANYSAAVGRFKSRPNGRRLVKNKLCVRYEQGAQLIYAFPSAWTSNSVDFLPTGICLCCSCGKISCRASKFLRRLLMKRGETGAQRWETLTRAHISILS